MDPDHSSDVSQHGGDDPSAPQVVRAGRRVFYGWWIVAAATVASTVQATVFNVGAQALVLPLIREFNTTRTAVSVAFSLRRLEGGLTGPIEGFLIHWVGPRRYMILGWVVFGVGLGAIGLCQNIYQFYAAFLLVTLGQSMAGFLPIVTVLVNWFDRKRGRAIAIYQLGASLGALLVPAFAWSILIIGWRQTTMAVGIGVIIIGIPLAAVMRPRPEDHGYLPDGVRPPRIGDTSVTTTDSETSDSLSGQEDPGQEGRSSISQALRSQSFWFLGLSHSAGLAAWGALQVHQIPALVDLGIDELPAAGILA